jgi:hypothetical protein
MYDYGKTNRFCGNDATLVLGGNNSLTINMALIETVTEFSAVVRTQSRY